jgi:hypothetical protein
MIQTKGNYLYDVKKIVKTTQETTYRVIAASEADAQHFVDSASEKVLRAVQTDFQAWERSKDYLVAEVALIVEGASW